MSAQFKCDLLGKITQLDAEHCKCYAADNAKQQVIHFTCEYSLDDKVLKKISDIAKLKIGVESVKTANCELKDGKFATFAITFQEGIKEKQAHQTSVDVMHRSAGLLNSFTKHYKPGGMALAVHSEVRHFDGQS